MKKVINGKRYDTETAKEIAITKSPEGVNDFKHWEEVLYKKHTGEYFLHGFGNAASKYAESCGNSEWTPGEKIIPLTYEAAQKWVEEHCDADEYEAEFGAIEETDVREKFTLSIPKSLLEAFRRKCSKEGLVYSEAATEAIKKWVESV